jgi:hypothetical protein
MGSWDETCFVSNLPIGCGDKVRYWLITRNPYAGVSATGGCYSNDQWFPRSPALQGTYADYGNINYTGPQEYMDFILKQFDDDLIELEEGDNRFHEQATKKGMDFDELQSMMSSSRICVHGGRKAIINQKAKDPADRMKVGEIRKLIVGFCMCHEVVYQDLVKSMHENRKSYFYSDGGATPSQIFAKHLAGLRESDKKLAEDIKLRLDNYDFEKGDRTKEEIIESATLCSNWRSREDLKNITHEGYAGGPPINQISAAKTLLAMAEDHVRKNKKGETDKKLLKRIIKDADDQMLFSSAIGAMRMGWSPPASKGQHNEKRLVKVLIRAMEKRLHKMRQD